MRHQSRACECEGMEEGEDGVRKEGHLSPSSEQMLIIRCKYGKHTGNRFGCKPKQSEDEILYIL